MQSEQKSWRTGMHKGSALRCPHEMMRTGSEQHQCYLHSGAACQHNVPRDT